MEDDDDDDLEEDAVLDEVSSDSVGSVVTDSVVEGQDTITIGDTQT